MQRIWSATHGKNLLAANYGGLAKEASGSGIWGKGGALAEFFNPTTQPESRLLVADVVTVTSKHAQCNASATYVH